MSVEGDWLGSTEGFPIGESEGALVSQKSSLQPIALVQLKLDQNMIFSGSNTSHPKPFIGAGSSPMTSWETKITF